eukprot:gene5983-biopygen9648
MEHSPGDPDLSIVQDMSRQSQPQELSEHTPSRPGAAAAAASRHGRREREAVEVRGVVGGQLRDPRAAALPPRRPRLGPAAPLPLPPLREGVIVVVPPQAPHALGAPRDAEHLGQGREIRSRLAMPPARLAAVDLLPPDLEALRPLVHDVAEDEDRVPCGGWGAPIPWA